MRSCQWYDTGGFDPILLSYRRCTMPPISSEYKEKVPGTEQGLGHALGFSLLELQEYSNLARRLNNKQHPPAPPWHKEKYRKYHNRGPNTTLWEIKGKAGSLCIRDTCVAEVAFALSVEEWVEFSYTGRLDGVYRVPDCTPETKVLMGAHWYPDLPRHAREGGIQWILRTEEFLVTF